MFQKFKDAAVSGTAKVFANRQLANSIPDFGRMTSLHIDSANKRISATVALSGEDAPVSIEVEYELETLEGKFFIKLKSIVCSKEWIAVLANQFGVGRKFELPEVVEKLKLL